MSNKNVIEGLNGANYGDELSKTVNTPIFYTILWSVHFIFVFFKKKRFDSFFHGFV